MHFRELFLHILLGILIFLIYKIYVIFNEKKLTITFILFSKHN
jgi:hypothetical protein